MTNREIIQLRINELQIMRWRLLQESPPHNLPPSIDWLNMTIAEHMKDLEVSK